MYAREIVSTLAEQLLQVKDRAAQARAGGRDARSIEAIGRSLRQTLASRVQFRDLREVAMRGFSLGVTPTGEVVVRHEDRVLPVSDLLVRVLFQDAGVELVPGQVLLLDGDVIRILVDEALDVLFKKGRGLDYQTARLVRAAQVVESQDVVRQPKAMGSSSGAA
ncbi:MAG TPA: hypothetical protein VKU80_05045 [Planctomycetota bacterium]|nr:hypothetical protein [Planctomycetota bacterium]